jgi:Zn-dependent protease with chaperone function/uncharacterized tellurite resistance protein B-like protein
MDFFGHQDAARKSTKRLVLLFALAVVATVAAVYVVTVFAFRDELAASAESHGRPFWPWNAQLFAWVAGTTGAVIAGGSLYKTAALSRGGGVAVASLLGGRPLDAGAASPAERRLLNVVEEMALAAGTAVPSVYVLPDEEGINAFAAGFDRDAAVIGVTRGAVERLDRDELQGVVAHELSHILNGDMRLNLRLIALLHGILVISLIGLWILRFSGGSSGSSDRKKGGGGGVALFGLALYVVGWIGALFGDLIKSAISRQREFLADAAAVQFTRNPLGIAGALKKIGGLAAGSRLESPNAPQASHLYFGNGLKEGHFPWRSTHPPLPDRIRRLDPAWDGTFPSFAEDPQAQAKTRGRGPARAHLDVPNIPGILGIPGFPHGATQGGGGRAVTGAVLPGVASVVPALAGALAPAALAASAGQPGPVHIAAAAAILAGMPAPLATSAREPMAARAVVLALLCDRDPAVRQRQLAVVAAAGDEALARELTAVLPAADALADEARLPLVDIAMPALRRLSPQQYTTFRGLVDELVRADQRLSLFEWSLHRVLLRHLDPWFAAKKSAPRATVYGLRQLGEPLAQLLSTLAHAGSNEPDAAAAAFAAGVAALGAQAPPSLALLPREACTFRRLDAALATLEGVAPPRLRELLTACAATVASDGTVEGAEGELLRAIADALGCPVPPLVVAA